MNRSILALNSGSSSLKFALFRAGEPPRVQWRGKIERIGAPATTFEAAEAESKRQERRELGALDRKGAANFLVRWIDDAVRFDSIAGIGHRVAHGGPAHFDPCLLTPDLVEALRRLVAFAPEHLPAEIALIDLLVACVPRVPQVVCFDTAFHRDLPRVAALLPLPRRLVAAGVRRYGFHGLSYAFLMDELARVGGRNAAAGRVVLAHLGSGSSLAAVQGGRSIDTTMAFTPASGLPMGTRSGDVDPGLVRYLARTEAMTLEQFDRLVNAESGLLGLSETTSDMRDLLAREASDVRAADAVELYCYQVRKGIGAYAAALDGLDTLVFAGGVGENAPEVRKRVCNGLAFIGVQLDDKRNEACDAVVSRAASRVCVRVIRTDEEAMIAKAVQRLLNPSGAPTAHPGSA